MTEPSRERGKRTTPLLGVRRQEQREVGHWGKEAERCGRKESRQVKTTLQRYAVSAP